MDHKNRLQRRALTAILIAVLAAAIGAVFGSAGNGTAASGTAPKEVNPPKARGTAQQGQTLDADHGDWSGTQPITYSYQWQRCDATGGTCAGISGADRELYDVKSQDVGHTLRVRVTAKNSAGSTSDTSAPTAVVTPATAKPPATGCPTGSGTVNVSQLSAPARLTIDAWTASPSTLGRSVGTLTLKVHVTACNGRNVQSALVYGAAVPFNQFSVTEQQSDSNGWATLSEAQQNGYPASSRQHLLAVFLRARKAGEPVGQGVSTSRLVSFRVNLHG